MGTNALNPGFANVFGAEQANFFSMAGRDGAVEKNWGRGRAHTMLYNIPRAGRTTLCLDLLSVPKLCYVDCITEAEPGDHEFNIPEN